MSTEVRYKLGKVFGLALAPDQCQVVTLAREVAAFDLRTGATQFRSRALAQPVHAEYAPTGEWVVVKGRSGQVVVLDATTGNLLVDFANAADGEGSNAVVSACGAYVVDGSWEGWLRVRAAANGALAFGQQFERELITHVLRDGAGERWWVVHQPVGALRGNALLPAYLSRWQWPLAAGGGVRLGLAIERLIGIALSADGERLAVLSGGMPAQLSVYRLGRDTELVLAARTEVPMGARGAVAWSPDGRWLGVAQKDRCGIYRSEDLAPVTVYPLPFPSAVAFAPAVGRLVLGDWQVGVAVPMPAVCAASR